MPIILILSFVFLALFIVLLILQYLMDKDNTVSIIGIIITVVFGFGLFCSLIPVKETYSYVTPDQILANDTLIVAAYDKELYSTSDALIIKRYKNGEDLKIVFFDKKNSYGEKIQSERKVSLGFNPVDTKSEDHGE